VDTGDSTKLPQDAVPSNRRSTLLEYDVTKCFGSLLHEKTAMAIHAPVPVPSDADWRGDKWRDSWMSAEVDASEANALRHLGVPERVLKGLPVPRDVLLALEECGVNVTPKEAHAVTYSPLHRPLMERLFAMHNAHKDGSPVTAKLAKRMMVAAYGKLAQDDTAWPVQREVRDARDFQLTQRSAVPSLRVELVREATGELVKDTFNVYPTKFLPVPTSATQTEKKNPNRPRVEMMRKQLAGTPDVSVLRVFPDAGYLVVRGNITEITQALDIFGECATAIEERVDCGLEMLSLAPRRQQRAKRPIFPGQDIAMRSWVKIYRLLARACALFGAEKVTVIRVMVDCLSLHVFHEPGVDVNAVLVCDQDGTTLGDGITPGTWKNEFEGKRVTQWFQLNKCAYEVQFTDRTAGVDGRKRRLGGLPTADREKLPEHFFKCVTEDGGRMTVDTDRGCKTYGPEEGEDYN
jgi:hypothetical protein